MKATKRSKKSKRGLRTGYTTGACAAAAAKAATLALITQKKTPFVTIRLPVGEEVRFHANSSSFDRASATCSIIKDAGDDPDVTHGAEIFAEVKKADQRGIRVLGGQGVGKVTKPGLGIEVGAPAINPVPMKMIKEAVRSVDARGGFVVTISVPGGEKLARKTLNARLGIVDGISILGTRGTVIPYSTSAFKQCVTQAISVARAAGISALVFTTGSRTEKASRKIIGPPDAGLIQVADFIGHALKEARVAGIKKVSLVAMFGKMLKLASGLLYTHARASALNMAFPARLAEEAGLPLNAVTAVKKANSARHVYEIIPERFLADFAGRMVCEAVKVCAEPSGPGMDVECILVDYEGNEVARSS